MLGVSSGNTLEQIQVDTSGKMSVNDSTAQASLTVIAGDTTSLDAKIPAKGQNAKSESVSVTIANDQGALSVSDSTAQSSLSTIATEVTSIDNKLPSSLGQTNKAGSVSVAVASDQGALSVSDSTAQTTLGNINSALGGTLTVSDSSAQSKLTSIQTAVEIIDDIVSTDGASYSASSSKGVMLLAKDNSGNFKPVELNASSELKVTSGAGTLSTTNTTVLSGVSVSNSSSTTSSAVDLNAVKNFSVFGNCQEGFTEVEILISHDDSTYVKDTSVFMQSDTNGDFAKHIESHARYVKVKYANDSGSSKTITAQLSFKN